MFWAISQEQHSIKTHEFTKTSSYFYSFTYEKNIFSRSSHKWVVSCVNSLEDHKAVDSKKIQFFRSFINWEKLENSA